MVPLSTSRLYIFNIETNLEDDLLIKEIHNIIKKKYSDLTYKNIEFKKVRKSSEGYTKKEIHINHLYYKNRRTFDIDTSNSIRLQLIKIFKLIPFQYESITLVNDDFDRKPSLGLSRGKL